MLEHVVGVVNSAVACCLGTDEGAAVLDALTCEHACELVSESLVLTEHVADLTSAYAEVACGNVKVGTDMSGELCHEALAETHNLCVRLALRIKVCTALAAAHGQGCKGVLEGLLEAEELDDTAVYVGSESDTALVGTDSGVELYAEAAVYMVLAVVVYPGNTEYNLSLGLNDALKNACLNKVGSLLYNRLNALEDLCNGLDELGLACVSLLYSGEKVDKVLIC